MSSVQLRSTSVVSKVDTDGVHLSDTAHHAPDGALTVDQSSTMPMQNSDRRLGLGSMTPETNAASPCWMPAEIERDVHPEPAQSRMVAPVPRITIQAFCESHDMMTTLEAASRDRLMSRATLGVSPGGTAAAAEFCRHNPVPNLLILESRAQNDALLAELEGLADVCDPGTRVLVIGRSNDISLYRELLRRGVSEYVVAPIGVTSLIAAISGIYREATSNKLGQVYAFVGAKGGVGSSTVAHNVGWTMARRFESDVVLADLDLPFGTAGLDFNLDVSQGVADAIQDPSRLDEVLFDRLLTKCDDHFSLLAAPATLDKAYDLDANAFASLLEIAQANVPFTILDMPHLWTSWARNALLAADEIVITAAPDLANLRNAKNLVTFLKQARPQDPPPKLVLNQVGMTKRPEIKPAEFARALELEPLAAIPFDAQAFGTAANNGKMIAATAAKSAAAGAFIDVAAGVAGRKEQRAGRRNLLDLRALLGRTKRRASS